MTPLATVILAAGKGTRMNSKTAKVLQPVGGRPLLWYAFQLARALDAQPVVVVVGAQAGDFTQILPPEGWVAVEQREPLGTGHAVQQTAPLLADFPGDVLVLHAADVSLLRVETLQSLIDTHRSAGAVATVLTTIRDEPGRLGRIVRDQAGHVRRIVEALDATEAERAIREINTGTYCFQASFLYPALQQLRPDNAKSEYYLTDVIGDACRQGRHVQAVQAADWRETLGVDSKADLAMAEAFMRERAVERLMANGVTVLDPRSTYVHPEVQVGRDTVLYPNTYLLGHTVVGEDCQIWPNSVIRDSTLGDGVAILPACVITGSTIAAGASVGPSANILQTTHERDAMASKDQPLLVDETPQRLDEKLRKLIEDGARIPKPETVTLGSEVRLENIIAKRLVIYPGTKIFGERTLILEGVELGYEEPVTLENAVLGENVKINGGYIKDSVLLDGCEVRQGFHAREGCLFEENVYCAHNVGIKMTIAFPFVVLGSLINFCDCLISGGTSRGNHSEIGSGFIHFNYTPRDDKATPSLFGDVPRGVMLNQPPIFLGGLCGVVGPSRVGFGSVLSAGKVYRSEYGEGLLILGEDFPTGNKSYDPNRLGSIRRKVFNNIFYIANLIALWSWYKYVRTMLVTSNPLKARLIRVALDIIGSNIYERVRQMDHFRGLVGESLQKVRILADSSIGGEMVQEQLEFFEMWDSTKSLIKDFHLIQGDLQLRDRFCDGIAQSLTDGPTEYIMAIQSIEHSDANMGTQWLTSIVDDFMIRLREVMPKNLKNIA